MGCTWCPYGPPEAEIESASTTPVDDMVSDALFKDKMTPPSYFHHLGNHPPIIYLLRILRLREIESENQEFEDAWKSFIVDKEKRQQRAREFGVSSCSSVSITDGAVTRWYHYWRYWEGWCRHCWGWHDCRYREILETRPSHLLIGLRLFGPHISFSHSFILYFLYIADNFTLFCWGWGKWIVIDRIKSE